MNDAIYISQYSHWKRLEHKDIICHPDVIWFFCGSFFTQNRLADEAFSPYQFDSDRELTQLGAIKMILMQQVLVPYVCVS